MSNNFDPKELLNTLSPEEKKVALSILEEMGDKGSSNKYQELIYNDYQQIPVTIDEFLDNDIYLGKGLNIPDADGKIQTVFPYWRKVLRKVFPNNLDTAYNTLILSGGIGLGKSFIAVICILYQLHRMLCLKDPYKHYGLQPIDLITFSLLNITLDAAKGVAWNKLQQLVQSSSWFMARGRVSTSTVSPEWQPNGNIELLCGSLPRHILGRAVFSSFEDEVSFQLTQDVERQKEKALDLISCADTRMQSRFMKGDKLPTLNILASSKRTKDSFLESYIELKKKNESKTTLIIDEPQWVIRNDKVTGKWFKIAVGNKFLENELLPLNVTEQELTTYRDKGYSILDVPFGYYEQFLDNLDKALTEIAGVSTSTSSSYISGVRWAACKNTALKNPMTKEVITVGNARDDKAQYYDFFDMTRVPKDMMTKPLFIHLDMSISGDKTGIAGTWIRGKKPHQEGIPDSKELYYQLAFSFAVKAPKGHQISFEKNRQFIYWLKEQGFNIKGVSFDSFNSVDLEQTLKAQGYNTQLISVDRLTGEGKFKQCVPYATFKSAIYEERIMTYPTTLLTEEIIGLVVTASGKPDHSPAGVNSKDISDSCAGSVYFASQQAEQFAYDYGESLETIVDFNEDKSATTSKQITMDFEKLLKEASPFAHLNKQPKKEGDKGEEAYPIYDDFVIL